MNKKTIILGVLAACGLGIGQTAALARSQSEMRQNVAAKNGGSTQQLEEDHFGSIAKSMLGHIERGSGCPPDVWGRSRECARMVRHNRMRRCGVAGRRI